MFDSSSQMGHPADSTISSKFISFTESSLCLKPNSDVSAAANIQIFGDAVTSGTTSIISSLTVPEYMVHGQEPVKSVTENAFCLVPSLELQQRQDKNKATSEPSAIFSKSVFVPSNSSVNSKVEVALKPKIHVVQKPKSTTGVSVHRDSSLDSQRKISQSVNGKAQLVPLGTETSGTALTGSMIGSASLSKSRAIQKQKQDQAGKRVKMPFNELLDLQVPLTYDGLNRLSATQLYKIRLSLRLRGCTGKNKKEALIHKILEAKGVKLTEPTNAGLKSAEEEDDGKDHKRMTLAGTAKEGLKILGDEEEEGGRDHKRVKLAELAKEGLKSVEEEGRDNKGVKLAGPAKEGVKSVEKEEGRDHKRVKLAGSSKEGQKIVENDDEGRPVTKDKFQLLCKVMKEVLGARVQDVVVSDHFISSSSCFLRGSDMGGMTMEINPEVCIIEDLRKRSDADKNDSYVRNASLVLFNCADMYRQSCLDMLKTTQELCRNLLETMQAVAEPAFSNQGA